MHRYDATAQSPAYQENQLCITFYLRTAANKREPTSGLEPLTFLHYESAVGRFWALQRFANPA
jgi:hypothetical protein